MCLMPIMCKCFQNAFNSNSIWFGYFTQLQLYSITKYTYPAYIMSLPTSVVEKKHEHNIWQCNINDESRLMAS